MSKLNRRKKDKRAAPSLKQHLINDETIITMLTVNNQVFLNSSIDFLTESFVCTGNISQPSRDDGQTPTAIQQTRPNKTVYS